MGYRHDLLIVEKARVEELKNAKKEDLIEEVHDDGYEELVWRKDLFKNHTLEQIELGKLYWGNDSELIEDTTTRLFNDDYLHEKYNEDNFLGVGSVRTLRKVIDIYGRKIQKNARKKERGFKLFMEIVFGDFDNKTKAKKKKQLGKYIPYVEPDMFNSMLKFYDYKSNYILDKKNQRLTHSWCYRDTMYDMLRVYKSTDWKKYTVVVTAG